MRLRKILFYVSSHGLGHAARASQVIKELDSIYTVLIKTAAPSWLFEQITKRKRKIYKQQFDVGCIQRNNQDVDFEKTIFEYIKQSEKNKKILQNELNFIYKNNIDLIISDIASFPFAVANEAGIPSIFIGNFTWKGIYESFIKDKHHPVINELEKEYKFADYAFITPLSMKMPELKNKKKINFIARKGKNIAHTLRKEFNIPQKNKIVFVYFGNRGMEFVQPEKVKKIDGFTFLSFYPLSEQIDNFIYLKPGSFAHEDIMASSDIALIKAGYGMVSEAMVHSVPIVYPPRPDFAEYYAFLEEFKSSGGTIQINRDDFDCGNWEKSLHKALVCKYKRSYKADGAKQCLQEIKIILNDKMNS